MNCRVVKGLPSLRVDETPNTGSLGPNLGLGPWDAAGDSTAAQALRCDGVLGRKRALRLQRRLERSPAYALSGQVERVTRPLPIYNLGLPI